jgi:hypothetical protein
MKKIFTLKAMLMAFAIVFTMFSINAYAADFTQGNIVVVRVGDGSATLSNASTAVFLEEYTTAGILVQTISIPTSGDFKLATSGTATSEGAISLSPNGKLLTIAGYDIAPGTASIANTTSAIVARKILAINKNGGMIALSSSTAYSANNIRSAVSNASGDYWAGGTSSSAGGVQYFGNGTAGQVSSTVTNIRVVNIFNDQLYFSTSSGTRGIYKVGDGTPTGTGVTSTNLIATGGSSSAYGFSFNVANSICYVADDRTDGNGGIQNWTSTDGTTWTLAYTLSVGASLGARGLTVDWTGTNPTLYATTTNSKLVSIVDSGSDATATDLVTAGTNTAFRGVAFAPYTDPTTSTQNTAKTTWTLANNTLNFDAAPATQIEIYSVTGSKMAVYEPAQQINLNLSKGVYILKVNNTAEKFMIQ